MGLLHHVITIVGWILLVIGVTIFIFGNNYYLVEPLLNDAENRIQIQFRVQIQIFGGFLSALGIATLTYGTIYGALDWISTRLEKLEKLEKLLTSALGLDLNQVSPTVEHKKQKRLVKKK